MSMLDHNLVDDGDWELDTEEGVPVLRRQQQNYNNKTEKPKVIDKAFVMPGEKLCIANEYYEAGEGAYEFGNFLYSAIVGNIHIQEFPEQELTVISVKRKGGEEVGEDSVPFVAPYVGAVATCTIVSRTDRLARCLITHVKGARLPEGIKGIIRREYISHVQRDLFEIVKSFGLGDQILARIVGICEGDFILSTAEDGLGVAAAVSDVGVYMVPIGWTQMECPKSKVQYPRKVAKIVQDKNVEYWQERNFKKNLLEQVTQEINRKKF